MKVEDRRVKVEDRQRLTGKRQKVRKLYLVAFACASLLLCTVSSAFVAVERYHRDSSLAQEGIQHLRTAAVLLEALQQNPFDTPHVQSARHEFASAATALVQVDNDLKLLPGASASLPVYGSRLSAAFHLLPIAIEVSQAGMLGCDILNLIAARFHDPLSLHQTGLTMADFTVIDRSFRQIKPILDLVIDQVNHLQPSDLQLDPRLGKIVATFRKQIPVLQAWLGAAESLLAVAPTLLGIAKPANYLVEVLDSTELRPGGGFIGNYGIATIVGGRLTTTHLTDSYLLDLPFVSSGHRIPYPAAYKWFDLYPKSWAFRDTNLDADFPTAARYGEEHYILEGGNVPVEGVIAITPALIQQALEIAGPINVPEYKETVTAQNLVDRIHFHQLGISGDGSSLIPAPDGQSSQRKHFVALLAEHFLARIHQLPASVAVRFVRTLMEAISTKDVQIYFNSDVAENVLQQFHLDGAIQAPHSGDSLMVVDANISPDKANNLIINKLDDRVVIDAQGDITHHTSISYAWTIPGKLYGSPVYRDYVRVYVPPGSILKAQAGWQPRGTSMAFGRQVWAGLFTLSNGQKQTITLTWTESGIVSRDAHGWHYQYLIQQQAGILRALHLQLTLPTCAAITDKSTGIASDGKKSEVLTQSLSQDLNVVMGYTC